MQGNAVKLSADCLKFAGQNKMAQNIQCDKGEKIQTQNTLPSKVIIQVKICLCLMSVQYPGNGSLLRVVSDWDPEKQVPRPPDPDDQ